MNRPRLHGLEKIQVQAATLAALVVVYALLWPALRPWDPEGPVTFLANGSIAQAGIFAAWLLAGAVVIALLTVTTRPQGAKLAVLIGAGGVSLRSPSIRSLLWLRGDHLAGLYGRFILEIVFLSLVLICLSVIVVLVRAAVGRVRPGWVWRDPLERTGGERRRSVYCLLLGMLITAVVVLLLLRSDERGQVLFALFVGSLVGFLAAHQVFPSPLSGVAWVGPMLLAIGFYTFAAIGVSGDLPRAWAHVPLYAHALPIDWMTAGAGGAMLGCWISSRIHETHHAEREKEQQKQD